MQKEGKEMGNGKNGTAKKAIGGMKMVNSMRGQGISLTEIKRTLEAANHFAEIQTVGEATSLYFSPDPLDDKGKFYAKYGLTPLIRLRMDQPH